MYTRGNTWGRPICELINKREMIRELWHEISESTVREDQRDRRLYYRSAEIKRATERENHKCSRFHAEEEVRWSIGGDLSVLSVVTSALLRVAERTVAFLRVGHTVVYSSHLSPSPPPLSLPLFFPSSSSSLSFVTFVSLASTHLLADACLTTTLCSPLCSSRLCPPSFGVH